LSKPVDPRLVRQAPAGRTLLAQLAGLHVVGGVLTIAQATVLARTIVDVFTGRAGVSAVAGGLVALAGIGVTRAVLGGAQEWLTARASLAVRAQLRTATLAAIVRLGPAWAQRQTPGRLVNATGPGLDGLDGYVTRALPALVSSAIVPALVLARITWADWPSGVILAVLLPLVPLFMALVGLTTRRLVARQYAILARMAGQFLDLLRGLTTLRIYGQAEAQEGTVRRATDAYRRQTVAALRVGFLSGLVLDLLAALSVAVVAVDIGLRLRAGSVGFYPALLVLILAPELFAPLRAMGAQHHANEEGSAAASAALDIVDEAPAPGSGTGAVRFTGDVEVIGVTVEYPGRDVPALVDASLRLVAGEITALAGPSGAGKSTLLAVLEGFVAPTAGTVRSDAIVLADTDPDAWRAQTAWLPQRPRPSQPTVADEVGLGDPSAPAAAVADACRTCRAPDPSVLLGEDGAAVSAGQRRRIALARVLLRARAVRAAGGVPLVLLDEPSEDLDRGTEAVVAAVLDGLRGWAIVVVATHSAALLQRADTIVTVEAGQLGEVRREPRAAAAGLGPAEDEPVRPAPVADEPTVRPYRLRDLVREAGATRRLLLATVLSVATTLSGLGLIASSMWLISRAAQHPNVQALSIAVVGVRTFAITRALLRYAERLATHDGALRMLAALRVRVFAALRPLPPGVLGSYGRGDLLRRFVGDVDGAQEGLVRAVVPAAGALAGAVGAVVLATALAPLAGLALGLGVLAGGVVVPVAAYLLAGDGGGLVRLAGERDRRSAALVEALPELIAYGRAGAEIEATTAGDAALRRAARRPALAAALGTFGGAVTASATLVAVLAAAASAVHAGALPVVEVGVLAVCVLSAFEAMAALPAAFVAWARCRAGLRRVAEVTGRPPAFAEPDAPAVVPAGPHGVAADAVVLAPAPDAADVVHGSSLDVAPGTRVALVGASGCGKSTLLAAALRLLPLRSGAVSVTGEGPAADVGRLRAADVPPLVAGSLQGDHVFDVTMRDNLRVVRPTASDDELDAVARRVGLLELVRSLPDGWSTIAGPDGAALSGGQRQRLLLARALLCDPDVLVLDEPTAHLDEDTERVVLDDLLDATAGRTVLLTTHRRLADGRVDRTVQLVDGQLVEVAAPSVRH